MNCDDFMRTHCCLSFVLRDGRRADHLSRVGLFLETKQIIIVIVRENAYKTLLLYLKRERDMYHKH